MRAVALAVVLASLLFALGPIGAVAQGASLGAFETDLAIDGRTLHAACAGTGGPSAIFETGGPDLESMVDFVREAGPDISDATGARFCGYDRAGTGDSPAAGDSVRSLKDAAADLLAVMATPEMACPCVIVGQSLGGAIALHALAIDPGLFAGLILLDAPPPGYFPAYVSLLPAGAPEASAESLGYFEGENEEKLNLTEGFGSLPEFAEPPGIPVVVVTHGLGDPPPCWPCSETVPTTELEEIWQTGQSELAASLGGRLVVSEKTDHFIAENDAEIVLELMAEVIAAAMQPSTEGTPIT